MTRRNPDPWGDYRRDRDDISTAAAFFMTFALLGLVAWVIFFGTGWIVPAAMDALPTRPTRVPSLSSSSVSTGVSFPLTTTTSTTASATSQAPAAAPTATPIAKPAATRLRIGNTGGDGAYLRRTPNDADLWIPWRDNTVVEYLNEDKTADGRTYKKVKDPRGNVGWIPGDYLLPT